MNKLEKAENEFNRRLIDDMDISLNDYYYVLELKSTSVGDILGWDIDDGKIEFKFGSIISDDGKPCLYIEPSINPHRDYQESFK